MIKIFKDVASLNASKVNNKLFQNGGMGDIKGSEKVNCSTGIYTL